MGWYTSSTVGFSFADVPPTTFILTSQNMAVSTSHRGKCQCFKLSPFFTPWDLLLIFSEVFFLILLQDQVQVHKRRGREIRNDLYMYIYIYISTLIPSSPPTSGVMQVSCIHHASGPKEANSDLVVLILPILSSRRERENYPPNMAQ